MALNHIAIMRSTARSAQLKLARDQETSKDLTPSSSIIDEELSQMSIISITNNEVRGIKKTSDATRSSSVRDIIKTLEETSPIERLETISDIGAKTSADQNQLEVLNKLEQQWHSLTSNIDTVINHLRECGNEVTQASTNCLDALNEVVELTCDEVDESVKRLYYLMTKCDELTTKLSVANSFRDEVRTLRKSVETLENLYKSRPQINPPKSP